MSHTGTHNPDHRPEVRERKQLLAAIDRYNKTHDYQELACWALNNGLVLLDKAALAVPPIEEELQEVTSEAWPPYLKPSRYGESANSLNIPTAPPIEPVGMRECLEEARLLIGMMAHLPIDTARIKQWDEQAQAALAATPVVEEVVTVDGVYCFKDVMASVLEKTKAGDRVRVVVWREEAGGGSGG